MTDHTDRHNPIGWTYFGQPSLKEDPPMTDHIDRELRQTINEVADIHNTFLDGFDEDDRHRATTAAILTLATVTHHQNGMKP